MKNIEKKPGLILKSKDKTLMKRIYKYRYMYVMYLPVFIIFLIFNYFPLVGVLIGFTKYTPFMQSPEWVGLQNFKLLFANALFWRAFKNTLIISIVNIILSVTTCVGLALLIDEIKSVWFRKVAQSLFISSIISALLPPLL